MFTLLSVVVIVILLQVILVLFQVGGAVQLQETVVQLSEASKILLLEIILS
jgi:hypothetical protein